MMSSASQSARLLLLLAALGTLPACDALTGGVEMDEIRVYVHVAPVKRGTVDRTLELTGTVQAGRAVAILPEVAGKVTELPFKVGESVKEGDVVARLDVEMASLQKKQADAAVRLAELALDTATKEHDRALALHEKGSLTDQQLERALSGLEMAIEQVKQATAAQGLARRQLVSGTLEAPFDGIVGAIAVEHGAYFNPMALSPLAGPAGLVEIIDLDTIKLDLQVSDRDVTLIEVGMPVRLEVDAVAALLPPEGLTGVVESVGMAADPASRTFPVRVVADNPDHIVRAGTHARVLLVLERAPDVLYVPDEAVIQTTSETYVLRVDGGIASRVPVEVGLAGEEGVEVRGALEPDVQVVVRGHLGVMDGAAVEVAQ